MLAFSTCWNSSHHTDGAAMLREIRDFGFEYVELGHGVRISLVEGILKAVSDGVVRICSVHNFCPLPPGFFDAAPNIYQFSARNDLEWNNAVRYTRNTIDFAARVGAGTVVLHSGKVPVRRWTHKLIGLNEEGKRGLPKYERVLQKALRERARHQARYFGQTIKSLHALVPYAAEKHVKLGIETRYGLEAIPDEAETEEILRLFPGETVGYWHDCGHAKVRENIGLGPSGAWLERFSSRLLGLHLHDVVAVGADHHAPGEGNVDFAQFKPYCSTGIPVVMELNPALPVERMRASVEYLRGVLQENARPDAATQQNKLPMACDG
jgi:sugar phosphate isomerase/epimerase